MKYKSLRMLCCVLTSIIAPSMTFATMDMNSRVTALENQMDQVRVETATGRFSPQTASANPEVDGLGWFIDGDILYWQTRVGGTEFAYSDQGLFGSLPISGRTKAMSFDWDWGFRIGLGYNVKHNRWDVQAQYTWFNTHASSSMRAGQNSSIVPLLGNSMITNEPNTALPVFQYCSSAKSQYDYDYQAVELEFGRAYFISQKLSFRPHWGVKAAWIDQEQLVRYSGGEPIEDNFEVVAAGLQGNTVHIKDESDFWGLGPRVGFDSKWYIGSGFTIFGNLSGSLLYGHFDLEHHERYSAIQSNRVRLSESRHAFSPTSQMQIGLRYDTYTQDKKQHFGVALGFEVEYWWRQNQVLKVNDSELFQYARYSEDVSMHGLTLDLRWDF